MEQIQMGGTVRSVNNVEPDEKGNVTVPQKANIDIVNLIYPVGSLYWSSQNTDPATLFGGTWKQIKDKFILAAGDTYAAGSTGGAASVALTVAQLPAHNHSASTNSTGEHTHTRGTMDIEGDLGNCGMNDTNSGNGTFNTSTWVSRRLVSEGANGKKIEFYASRNWWGSTSYNGSHSHTVTVNNTGEGRAHENMPPYIAYYCWERTA